jgi:starvation-inducible DNA-binding protein
MAPRASAAGSIASDEHRSRSGPGPSGTEPRGAEPRIHQRAQETQAYNQLVAVPIALAEKVRADSVAALNQVLADTMTLRDLYKKHHWQTSGATFYQLHLLYDTHWKAQVELVDGIAERIQTLGGIAIAMAADVAETTLLPRPPRGREEVPVQLSRLIEAHEMLLQRVRAAAKRAAESGDDGTNDLLVSDLIRTHESQVWFLSEHLVAGPLTRAR